MIPFFYFAGLPWRMGFARMYPRTWSMMERAAYARHARVFGNPHVSMVRAFYWGRM